MDRMLRNKKTIALFITPIIVVFSCFLPIPLIFSLGLSLFKWDMLQAPKFIGMQNFIRLFTLDDIFIQSIGNTLQYLLFSVIMQIPLAMIFAIMLTRGKKHEKFFTNIIFLPVTLSGTAVALMFYFIFHPTGIANALLSGIGLEQFTRSWLADEGTAMLAVCIKVAWQFVGYHMVIYITGISNISEDLIEAAKIDGASTLQTSFRIILPLLKPAAMVSMILIATSSLKSFDSIFVMTRGGPLNATEVMASHMYNKAFLQMDYGYGSAIGVILFILCIIVTQVLTMLFQDKKEP